jgi:predicted transcriptional regulator of viral defense system
MSLALKKEAAKRPVNCYTIEEIAKEMDCSEESAQAQVRELIRRGKATAVRHKKLGISDQLIPCVYYKLTSKSS